MKKDPVIFIKHITESIGKIEEYTKGITKGEFTGSPKTHDAVIRNLEIIGEAAKNVPKAFRDKYPGVRWREISGLRDVLIHMYFGVDLDIVWNIIKKDIPMLKGEMEGILEKTGGEEK